MCLEGYYDETIFHRIISGKYNTSLNIHWFYFNNTLIDFAAQGGDPTGTGEGNCI